MPSAKLDNLMQTARRILHEDNPVCNALGYVEEKTKIDRLYIASAVVGCFSLYMIFGYFAELVCNLVGFVFPAYCSVKAIESPEKEDDTHWLTYWIVFSLFSVIEFFVDIVFSWFPVYWLAKICFIVYLFLPQTRGAQKLYLKYIRPFAQKHFPKIDSAFHEVTSAGMNGVSQAMNDMNTMTKQD